MAGVAADGLTKVYRDARGQHIALDGVSFSIPQGRTLVVLGPSGAGKSTLLRLLAGLERPDAGTVRFGDRDVADVPPERRGVALVFQDDALFPHLSVYDNLAFGLRVRKAAESSIRERVTEIARALAIEGHLRDRPGRLSGGERQRASIARAILSEPYMLALDEPLAHLDPALRERVRSQFKAYRAHFRGPALYVTHDHAEAFALADELAVLMDGRIVQRGDPQDVYDFPSDVRVARFFGSPQMNLLDDGMETIGIRPENVLIRADGALRGGITACAISGAERYVEVATDRGLLLARMPHEWHGRAEIGERVGLDLPSEYVRRFDRSTGAALR
ncbi:MAG: ABC transporter ATP-binding protein [Candidatus Eremiobacteraeota bacterium]|nr:ABC transporter ATP-binding protein [Candidatus Eremiobacteraeota bacterium]